MFQGGSGALRKWVWKYIKRGWGLFSSCVRYEVGDGVKVRFCHDLWCGEQPLKISCLVLHVLRMRGWRIICISEMEIFNGIFFFLLDRCMIGR